MKAWSEVICYESMKWICLDQAWSSEVKVTLSKVKVKLYIAQLVSKESCSESNKKSRDPRGQSPRQIKLTEVKLTGKYLVMTLRKQCWSVSDKKPHDQRSNSYGQGERGQMLYILTGKYCLLYMYNGLWFIDSLCCIQSFRRSTNSKRLVKFILAMHFGYWYC